VEELNSGRDKRKYVEELESYQNERNETQRDGKARRAIVQKRGFLSGVIQSVSDVAVNTGFKITYDPLIRNVFIYAIFINQ
jgi:hypothetical protein